MSQRFIVECFGLRGWKPLLGFSLEPSDALDLVMDIATTRPQGVKAVRAVDAVTGRQAILIDRGDGG